MFIRFRVLRYTNSGSCKPTIRILVLARMFVRNGKNEPTCSKVTRTEVASKLMRWGCIYGHVATKKLIVLFLTARSDLGGKSTTKHTGKCLLRTDFHKHKATAKMYF